MDARLDVKSSVKVIELIEKTYPDSHYYLDFSTPIELLVAAILSAQTRDTVVNGITPKLFKKYHTAKDYSEANQKELESYVSGVSFAGNKVRNIIRACEIVDKEYGGRVPNEMKSLLELPGIGRKTANTILINAYGIVEGIPVDTWVIKISNRTGLSVEKNPDNIEEDLKAIVDKKYWKNIAYAMKAHGHAICRSSIPLCSKCFLNKLCMRNGVKDSG